MGPKKKRKIEKTLHEFIKDESGFVSKEKILKIGLGTISALGILSAFSANLIAGHTNHSSHANNLGITPYSTRCVKIDHVSHYSHSSHGSY
ncbi:hypothetical protein BU251_04190 [Candidatus Velamenicoccus archaeovorus]|uniref:Uncharacterized protein n=1 Tax=Velamenicoccus archaeovorus TaxID=1930593 RepID=A0A410P458_VELA1|nr:hypothetical protein [Candidatus Velamenicoccus archaeovorus]QAT16987.1 hypothetical protein BU251_04190 [Candidatus Velamenicoccus archaeovorus]